MCQHKLRPIVINGRIWLKCEYCDYKRLHELEEGDAVRKEKTKR